VTLVALPLFKVELSYLVRHGRRWTVLEHLLLWALSREPRGLADLARDTNMPQRLIVESLVNLLKVGWIELTTVDRAGVPSAVLFTANGRGRAASSLSELPYAFDLEKRFSALYVDRLTASVLREDQIQLRHRDQLDRGRTIILRPDFDKYDVSPGLFFDSLAMRPDDQFERSLDRRLISVAQYALLEVIGDEVAGLPPDAPARLSEVILRRTPLSKRNPDERSAPGQQRRSPCLTDRPKFAPAEVGSGDILMGGRDHRLEIDRVLREAQSVVYIHSTFIGGALDALVPKLVAAAERPVDVVLLWGERRDPSQSLRTFLRSRYGLHRLCVAISRNRNMPNQSGNRSISYQ
jgi:hypothetical protein